MYFKKADISPRTVLAGDSLQVTVSLRVSETFKAGGSRLILDLPAYLGTSRPSLLHPEDSGYVTVMCSNPSWRYTCRNWDMEINDFATPTKTSWRGMAQRLLVVDFTAGQARSGDEIKIIWGWTRHGFGGGAKMGVLSLAPEFYHRLHVRYFKNGRRGLPDFGRSFKGFKRPIPDEEHELRLRVLPREPERVVVTRSPSRTRLAVLDRFANVCPVRELTGLLKNPPPLRRNRFGVFEGPVDTRVGSARLPLDDSPDMRRVFDGLNIYFGDLHTHSSFSNDCIEREKQEMDPDAMFAYARQVRGLDFMAVTDHHQPWDGERNKIGRANWERSRAAVRAHHRPGKFVSFSGMEYRCPRGDTVVIWRNEPSYRLLDNPSLSDVRKLWQAYQGLNYLTIPHFHAAGKLPENEWWQCPDERVEPLLEMFSCHESYEAPEVQERGIAQTKSQRPDRTAAWLLGQGLRYGLCANSDGHKGNPGSNGLMAVYAPALDRDSLLEAIRQRQVYGTTNARLRVLFTVNGRLMGSVQPRRGAQYVEINVQAIRPLKAVDLIGPRGIIRRFEPGKVTFRHGFTLPGRTPPWCYLRVMQLDNEMAWTSPIFFGEVTR
jgi:hypothetical protein